MKRYFRAFVGTAYTGYLDWASEWSNRNRSPSKAEWNGAGKCDRKVSLPIIGSISRGDVLTLRI